jgi:hypothetical protein
MIVPIKQQNNPNVPAGQPNSQWFAVPVMVLNTPQGTKSIPNPSGQQVATFATLEEAVKAIEQAGFDAEFEGRLLRSGHEAYPQRQNPAKATPFQAAVLVEDTLKKAVPLLHKRLGDKEPQVLSAALQAIGQLQPPALLKELLPFLGHDVLEVRQAAVATLARYGPSVLEVVSPLYAKAATEGRGNDKAYRVRLDVMNLYLALLHEREATVLAPVLSQVLHAMEDEQWLVRSAASQVLGAVAKAHQAAATA